MPHTSTFIICTRPSGPSPRSSNRTPSTSSSTRDEYAAATAASPSFSRPTRKKQIEAPDARPTSARVRRRSVSGFSAVFEGNVSVLLLSAAVEDPFEIAGSPPYPPLASPHPEGPPAFPPELPGGNPQWLVAMVAGGGAVRSGGGHAKKRLCDIAVAAGCLEDPDGPAAARPSTLPTPCTDDDGQSRSERCRPRALPLSVCPEALCFQKMTQPGK